MLLTRGRPTAAAQAHALRAAGALLNYPAARGAAWSNASLVAPEPARFAANLRNDTSYPETSRVAAEDWTAVVHDYNYSSMGVDFHRSGVGLKKLVEQIHAQQRAEREAKEAERRKEREARRAAGARGGKRGGRGGGGRGRGRRLRARDRRETR